MEMTEGSEVTTEPGLEDAKQDGGKKAVLIRLVVVGLISLGSGGAVGATLLGPTVGERLAQKQLNPGDPSEDGGHGGGGHGGEEPLTPHIVDNLVVNPAGSGGMRFLLTSVAIQVGSPDAADLLEARDVELRDVLIMVLGSKTVEELSDITLRKGIVDEVLRSLEDITGPEVIQRVFLPQYVIQ